MAEHNYDNSYRDFSWPRPERFNFARDVVDKWAERDPDKLALFWVDDQGAEERRTFADISAASCRVANLLQGAGVRPGDYVVMILGRQMAWWEVFTAALRMGAVISPGYGAIVRPGYCLSSQCGAGDLYCHRLCQRGQGRSYRGTVPQPHSQGGGRRRAGWLAGL